MSSKVNTKINSYTINTTCFGTEYGDVGYTRDTPQRPALKGAPPAAILVPAEYLPLIEKTFL